MRLAGYGPLATTVSNIHGWKPTCSTRPTAVERKYGSNDQELADSGTTYFKAPNGTKQQGSGILGDGKVIRTAIKHAEASKIQVPFKAKYLVSRTGQEVPECVLALGPAASNAPLKIPFSGNVAFLRDVPRASSPDRADKMQSQPLVWVKRPIEVEHSFKHGSGPQALDEQDM